MMKKYEKILTGIKPTWVQMHIGNYFWAVKPAIDLANQFPDAQIITFIPNMHALTQLKDPQRIYQNSINITKWLIASWADPERYVIFNSSDVPAHAQLTRILMCYTGMWMAERMHAYKDAIQKNQKDRLNLGTFAYPVLMAADILLYDADAVPVGKDQKQHGELALELARKLNNAHGEVFKYPKIIVKEDVATVPGVDGRKMSKSYHNTIGMFDDAKTLMKKVKQIKTHSIQVDEPKNPDECNVYNIIKLFLSKSEDEDLRKRYLKWWLSYKEVKDYLYTKLLEYLLPFQHHYNDISDEEIVAYLKQWAVVANEIASKKIIEIEKAVGFRR